MSEIRDRVIKCFSAVFPQLTEEEIQLVTPTMVEGWDSVASITLISVIEEEFGTQIDPDEIEHLVSFEKVLDYVNKKYVTQ